MPGRTNKGACGAAAGQWCTEASVFGSFGQRNGPSVPIDPDDHLTIEYKLGSDNNTWTQTVTSQKLGKVVSTLTSTSGLMLGGGFGFATEADANSYTIDTQYYLCTEIHLAAADPSFAATGVGGIGAKMGATGTGSGIGTIKNLHTPDSGLTWLADLITLPPMNPQGTQTAAPAYSCGTSGTGGSTGSGGSGGSGGSTGRAGNSGSGGSGGGGSAGKGGNTGAGGTVGGAGSTGKGGNSGGAGSTGKGGDSGSGGTTTTGSGGTTTTGTGGTTTGTGGTTTGTGGLTGTGGADQGSGGSTVAGTGGTSGTGTGGATGTGETGGSAGTEDGSSGCGCVVGARSPRGGMFAFSLLGVFALRARRRRNRS